MAECSRSLYSSPSRAPGAHASWGLVVRPYCMLAPRDRVSTARPRSPLITDQGRRHECHGRSSTPSSRRRWSGRTRGRTGSTTSCSAATSASRSSTSTTPRPTTTRPRPCIRDQEEAGLDIVTDGQMCYDDYVGVIGSFCWYMYERIPGFEAGEGGASRRRRGRSRDKERRAALRLGRRHQQRAGRARADPPRRPLQDRRRATPPSRSRSRSAPARSTSPGTSTSSTTRTRRS